MKKLKIIEVTPYGICKTTRGDFMLAKFPNDILECIQRRLGQFPGLERTLSNRVVNIAAIEFGYRIGSTSKNIYKGGNIGLADLCFIDSNGISFLELKQVGGKLGAAQEFMMNKLNSICPDVYVVFQPKPMRG